MRKFMINVNGKSYEVEVEELGGSCAAPAVPAAVPVAAPAPAAAPVAAPAPAPAPAAGGSAGAVQITAPMPGTILSIKASVGQAVKKGEPVVVLEAMKMENEIVAPQDGTIASVNTTQGASVNNGDLLLTMN
ncbi:MAG: biotin/lipoyl-binding protein [Ruminococcaceae bacterium]|nr:biotin/lipoyl-binding protein [Oscillospiraceae bacterium]